MPYGQIDSDKINTSVANTSLGAGNATRFKNRIINGDMRIDQRNAGASVATTVASGATTYTLDRWAYVVNQASKFTVQQNAGSVTPPTGFTNYLGCTSTSAYSVGTTDVFAITQPIEGLNCSDLGWGTANAKTVTLSAWVYSSLTGTFGGALRNSANNRSYPFTYTISSANTWTQISVTVAGDTTGTWLTTNGIGMYVFFGLGSGSTYSGTAGSWSGNAYLTATGATSVVGTNGATFYITGVQLEVGSNATGFEYVDYGTQLAMCYRYHQGQQSYYGLKTASGYTRINIALPAVMRTSPSVTFSDVVGNASKISIYYGNDARTDNVGAIACAGAGISQFQLLPNNTDSAPGYAFLASMSAEL